MSAAFAEQSYLLLSSNKITPTRPTRKSLPLDLRNAFLSTLNFGRGFPAFKPSGSLAGFAKLLVLGSTKNNGIASGAYFCKQ
jgi:hypothetical protein